MTSEPLADFDLRQGFVLQDAASDYGGGGSGGGPGAVLGVNSGRIMKSNKEQTALERARLQAEMVRQEFKEKRKRDQGSGKKEVQVEGVLSPEMQSAVKYENRLQINRRSAAASRVRREAYIKILEKSLVELEQKCDAMSEQLEAANRENTRLLGMLPPPNSQGQIADFPDIDKFLNEDFL